jgi:GntR family transcriptional regulator
MQKDQLAIGRNNPLPLYYQLKMQIIEQLDRGELAEGQILPSEHSYQLKFGISRATIRQAFNELENEGILERRQGVGTFVSRKKIAPEINKLTSFSEDMLSRGFEPGSIVLQIEEMTAPPSVRESLNLSPYATVWSVSRLRLADNEPMGIHNLFIPPWLNIQGEDLASLVSYYKLLEDKRGLRVVRGEETLTAKIATDREAELLKIEPCRPLLFIKRVSYDTENRPLEYVEFVYRADRYQYHLSLYRE